MENSPRSLVPRVIPAKIFRRSMAVNRFFPVGVGLFLERPLNNKK